MTAEDGTPQEAPALQVTIVAPVVTAATHTLADELRRDSLHVDVSSADVLRETAAARVYVFCCDAALAIVLADRIVEWGGGRAGLIGVIADGGGHEREALLAAGFDDAIAGRLSARELSARARAVHRRINWSGLRNGRLRFGMFTLDITNRALWTAGRTISLTSTELEVMRALMNARGRPLSRTDLLDAVWGGGDLEVSERAVDNVILRLRRKLPQPESIETVRGVGFRLT
ncbi:MAG: response regulator transcription factor [Kofleriaceae bacterium]|nr:response regulator transcription factor [Kofleriaceae bacterium]